ncbi:MAG: glycosyltransferase [bacterium]
MYNILFISPISIAGTLIIKGLAKGFQQCGNNILILDVRELDFQVIKNFNPDFAIGYDYAHFVIPQAQKTIKEFDIPIIHYFADAPNSNFAHSGNLELFKILNDSGNIVFCWDKQYLSLFSDKASYLPLGINPDLYSVNKIILENPEKDIVFAGRPLTNRRLILLSEIVKNFPDKLEIYSYKKHFETSVEEMEKMDLLASDALESYKNSYRGFLETERDLAKVYANSKIVLNITMDQGLSSMNYRVFEVLATGAFLLTDYKKDTADYFSEKEELVFYRNKEELIKNILEYLKNDSERIRISKNGKDKVLKYHTFKQRANKILENISFN